MNDELKPKRITVNNVSFDLIDPDDSIDAETFCGLGYEPGVCTLLQKIVKNQAGQVIFLDVGAHYGFFPNFIKKISPDSIIHAVEPGHNQLDILRSNAKYFDSCSGIHPVAFSDKEVDQSFIGRKFSTNNESGSYLVKSIKGDDFLSENHISPNIVKIDVHGLEVKVLRGLSDTLQKHIRHLFIEVHAQHLIIDGDYSELLSIIEDAGFIIFEMIDFRFDDQPKLSLLSGLSRERFINYNQWRPIEIKHERMLYCYKP